MLKNIDSWVNELKKEKSMDVTLGVFSLISSKKISLFNSAFKEIIGKL
jgi:hypothetical protein